MRLISIPLQQQKFICLINNVPFFTGVPKNQTLRYIVLRALLNIHNYLTLQDCLRFFDILFIHRRIIRYANWYNYCFNYKYYILIITQCMYDFLMNLVQVMP